MLLTRDEIRGVGKARDVGRLQAASVVILDVVRRKRADEVVARSGRKRRQIEKIEDREEDIGEKYKSARTGEATPSSVKKTPARTGEGPARRRLAEVRAAALAYDEEVQAASVAEEPAAPQATPKQPTPKQSPSLANVDALIEEAEEVAPQFHTFLEGLVLQHGGRYLQGPNKSRESTQGM